MKEMCWSGLWAPEPTAPVFPQWAHLPVGLREDGANPALSKYKCSVNGGAYDYYLLGGW